MDELVGAGAGIPGVVGGRGENHEGSPPEGGRNTSGTEPAAGEDIYAPGTGAGGGGYRRGNRRWEANCTGSDPADRNKNEGIRGKHNRETKKENARSRKQRGG